MRVLIWVIILMLLGYAASQLYQVWRVSERIRQTRQTKSSRPRPASQPAAVMAAADVIGEVDGGDDDDEVFVFEPPAFPGQTSWSSEFGEQLQAGIETQQLRQELARMEEEVVAQRGEIAALKEQLDILSSAQNVSPEYNEALVLARRGLDVETIAERCGISVAEAELVRALTQKGSPRTEESGS